MWGLRIKEVIVVGGCEMKKFIFYVFLLSVVFGLVGVVMV